MRYITLVFSSWLGCTLLVQSAWAASIVNLSGAVQVIELRTTSGHETVEIKPDERFSWPGQLYLRYQGREITIDSNEEYAMWKGGTFGPQRRFKHHKKGL